MNRTRIKTSNDSVPNSIFYEYNQDVYDHLSYQRDADLCTLSYLQEHGSPLIRSYLYDTAPYQVPNKKKRKKQPKR